MRPRSTSPTAATLCALAACKPAYALLRHLATVQLNVAMSELDTSGDGEVDFPEFKAYWDKHKHMGGGMIGKFMVSTGKLRWAKVPHRARLPCSHPRITAAVCNAGLP